LPSYTPFYDLPATTFDFGQDGYTGSSNIGGELLQLTAPYDGCGFVAVKGDFEASLDSIIARAQRPRGGKATFGIKVPDPPTDRPNLYLSLGKIEAKGTFNHRWPFNRFALERDEERIGSCSMFSCVKDGTLYQVVRLSTAEICSDRSIAPWLVSGREAQHLDPTTNRVALEFGGVFRFSCLCGGLQEGSSVSSWNESNSVGRIEHTCLPGRKLVLQIFVNGKRFDSPYYASGKKEDLDKIEKARIKAEVQEVISQPQPKVENGSLKRSKTSSTSSSEGKPPVPLVIVSPVVPPAHSSAEAEKTDRVRLLARKDVYLLGGKPVIVVATFTIECTDEVANTGNERKATPLKAVIVEKNEAPTILPTSEDFWNLAGIDKESYNATNMLCKEIYLNATVGANLKPSVEEISLVARSLEKILGPYQIPVTWNGNRASAPVNTLCLQPCVSFQDVL
jgi:hypothetical protein